MKEKPTGKILRTLRHRALTQHKQAEASSSSSQNLGAAGRTQKHKAAEPSTSRQDTPGKTQHKRAEPRTQQQQAEAGSSRQNTATAGRTQRQQAEPSSSTQNPAAARRTQRKRAEPSTSRQIPAGTDSNSRGQNHTEPKYDKFQWARLSPNYWQWHHHKDCNQYHTGLNRIMSTIHCPQRWNSIQTNSQSNKEKNYQNLNETLRARRCDTTSGHLVRRKPSG